MCARGVACAPRCAKIFRLPYFSIFLRGGQRQRCASAILQFIWPQSGPGRVDLNVYGCVCVCVCECLLWGVSASLCALQYSSLNFHVPATRCQRCHCKIYDFTRRCRHGLSPTSSHTHPSTPTPTHTHTRYAYKVVKF